MGVEPMWMIIFSSIFFFSTEFIHFNFIEGKNGENERSRHFQWNFDEVSGFVHSMLLINYSIQEMKCVYFFTILFYLWWRQKILFSPWSDFCTTDWKVDAWEQDVQSNSSLAIRVGKYNFLQSYYFVIAIQ